MCPESTRQELAETDRHGDAAGTVYTYFHAVPELDEAEQHRQIEVWAASWRRYGWTPVVLGREQAWAAKEEADAALAVFAARPNLNRPLYTAATYMRWFALRTVGGGLMTDYDVVNVGLRPARMREAVAGRDCVCFCPCWVPAAVHATLAGCQRMIDILLAHKMTTRDLCCGQPHTSDMYIFSQESPGPIAVLARELGDPDHGELLVHVSNDSVARAHGRWAVKRSAVMASLAALTEERER
jgi:hypothetical protein